MKQKRVIINADDCGMSQYVNEQIEQMIVAGKITSTTVMANMDDFEGAVALYEKYKDQISFGWHINLTEGKPLLESQLLLDKGYYIEEGGKVVFNGKAFWKKSLSNDMKNELRKELTAQCNKLRDGGIVISHADSHQHIHTSPSLFWMMPMMLQDLGISKCRRIKNTVTPAYNRWIRNAWALPYKMKGIKLTDTFCTFGQYFPKQSLSLGDTVEFMCHPGHPGDWYVKEYEILKSTELHQSNFQYITYRDL